jgi:SAM-dependent methyltransferase
MDLINKVEKYYSEKIKTFGPNNYGVDWNSQESQFLRFEQLCKIISNNGYFSILDFGCGYGALFEFLKHRNYRFNYFGFDISKEMIDNAKRKYYSDNLLFTNDFMELKQCDYVVASGVFNVKLDTPTDEWEKYINNTISQLNSFSKKGFAFNLLTSYSDKELMKDYLYYANPNKYFDLCKKKYSKNVALLHDYDLYEFTILIRK